MNPAPVPLVSTAALEAALADPGLRIWLIHATDRVAFGAGHLPGALACPDDASLARLAGGTPVVVYGEDEHARAAPALVVRLRAAGVEVAWFAGGLVAWAAAGLPVEAAQRPDSWDG